MRNILLFCFAMLFINSYEAESDEIDVDSLKKTIGACSNMINRLELGENLNSISIPYHQPNIIKTTARFIAEGKKISIVYCRTAWILDAYNTDDEYTPLIFIDNILSAIGWEILGGPKTFGDKTAYERATKSYREKADMQRRALYNLCRTMGDPSNCHY